MVFLRVPNLFPCLILNFNIIGVRAWAVTDQLWNFSVAFSCKQWVNKICLLSKVSILSWQGGKKKAKGVGGWGGCYYLREEIDRGTAIIRGNTVSGLKYPQLSLNEHLHNWQTHGQLVPAVFQSFYTLYKTDTSLKRTTDPCETVNGHLRSRLYAVNIPQNRNVSALHDSKLQTFNISVVFLQFIESAVECILLCF